MAKVRLDNLLVNRKLAESRQKAQAMILAGQVLVNDQRIDKPGRMVDEASEVRIKGEQLRYVSRGGLKLEAALREFNVSVADLSCIDVGASTGGFTDCLLQHGARQVTAIDVGHNQLAWKLRQDRRVRLREGVNARYLSAGDFPERFDIATMDLSFISITKVLPALITVLKPGARIIALIKPQFEVGRNEVGKGGIVKDAAKHQRVINDISAFACSIGLTVEGVIESPISGADGNKEFLMLLGKQAGE